MNVRIRVSVLFMDYMDREANMRQIQLVDNSYIAGKLTSSAAQHLGTKASLWQCATRRWTEQSARPAGTDTRLTTRVTRVQS